MKKFPKAKIPKLPSGPKAPKANVLGPLGRTGQPPTVARPNNVVPELAREADSPLSESTYVAPKPRKM